MQGGEAGFASLKGTQSLTMNAEVSGSKTVDGFCYQHQFMGQSSDGTAQRGGRIGGCASVETNGEQMHNGGLAGGPIGGRASVETNGKKMRNGGLACASTAK
jgi:hypothetical protein